MIEGCPAGFEGDEGQTARAAAISEAQDSMWQRGAPSVQNIAQDSATSMRDRRLVLDCLAGDEDAWEALVKSYSRPILNLSWRFTGRRDLAEDLTQEIFLKAYRNLDQFRFEEAGFRTWLYRLGRNLLIDHHRKEKRYSLCSGSESLDCLNICDDRAPGPQRVLEQAEAARFLEEGLKSLPFDLRQAITLRELEGLSYRQIARVVGAPEGTIKSRVSRARLQLERLLARRRLSRSAPRRLVFRNNPFHLSYA